MLAKSLLQRRAIGFADLTILLLQDGRGTATTEWKVEVLITPGISLDSGGLDQ